MASLSNTLYPPVVSTFMPSFVNTDKMTIYFSISNFNTSTNIHYLHVTLQSQKNNLNCFKSYSSGIWITDSFEYDEEKGMYKVDIESSMVSGGQFNINQYYKVQLRFDSYGEETGKPDTTTDANNDYLINNQSYFSEWSTVCLIKPILQPDIYLTRLDNEDADNSHTLSKVIQPIVGKLYFVDSEGNQNDSETETLESYQFTLLDSKGENVVQTYDKIFTSTNLNPNTINTKIDLTSPSIVGSYILKIDYTTKNQYSGSKTYEIAIADYADTEGGDWISNVIIEAEVDEDNGTVNLYIDYSNVSLPVGGLIHVRRTSSESSFDEWETIGDYKATSGFKKTIVDYTVNSMVWYRYSVYYEAKSGAIAKPKNSSIVYPNFEACLIYHQGKQLKLKYNYKVSSYKSVVNRSKIDTLGGKYPKFAENAILNYKQFSVSGTLTGFSDIDGAFLSRYDYFTQIDGTEKYYIKYLENSTNGGNGGYGIDTEEYGMVYVDFDTYNQNDVFWERTFREAAATWLNNGEPKLYRSPTEGLMVVMFTDISLTPNETLGKRIWDFSATAYEVADGSSLEKLSNLGIFEVPTATMDSIINDTSDDNNSEDDTITRIAGQLYNFSGTSASEAQIKTKVTNNLSDLTVGVRSSYHPGNQASYVFSHIKVLFTSKPKYYQIRTSDHEPVLADLTAEKTIEEKAYLFGYRIKVRYKNEETWKTIFINSRGYYQFPADIEIDNLQVCDDGVCTIEYVLRYKRTGYIAGSDSGTKVVVGSVAGQYYGELSADSQSLGIDIKTKYNKTIEDTASGTTTVIQMLSWGGLVFDVAPYSVFKIRHTGETSFEDSSIFVVGTSGYLNLGKEYSIQDVIYAGKQMYQSSYSNVGFLDENQFALDEHYNDESLYYLTINFIDNPKYNVVYKTRSYDYIYRNDGTWAKFEYNKDDKTGIVKINTFGAINYTASLVQSVTGGSE